MIEELQVIRKRLINLDHKESTLDLIWSIKNDLTYLINLLINEEIAKMSDGK